MDGDDNHERRREFYRKFVRPAYKRSMVSSRTDARWRKGALASQQNLRWHVSSWLRWNSDLKIQFIHFTE